MDTGRSFKMSQQTAQRGKSSQTSSSEMDGADTWKLPRGVPAMDTVAKLLSPEREKLCQAAVGRVEGFEVLTPRDMASLSKVRCLRVNPTTSHVDANNVAGTSRPG